MTTTSEITNALEELADALVAADEAFARFREEHADDTNEAGTLSEAQAVAMITFPGDLAAFTERLAKAHNAFAEADDAA